MSTHNENNYKGFLNIINEKNNKKDLEIINEILNLNETPNRILNLKIKNTININKTFYKELFNFNGSNTTKKQDKDLNHNNDKHGENSLDSNNLTFNTIKEKKYIISYQNKYDINNNVSLNNEKIRSKSKKEVISNTLGNNKAKNKNISIAKNPIININNISVKSNNNSNSSKNNNIVDCNRLADNKSQNSAFISQKTNNSNKPILKQNSVYKALFISPNVKKKQNPEKDKKVVKINSNIEINYIESNNILKKDKKNKCFLFCC